MDSHMGIRYGITDSEVTHQLIEAKKRNKNGSESVHISLQQQNDKEYTIQQQPQNLPRTQQQAQQSQKQP